RVAVGPGRRAPAGARPHCAASVLRAGFEAVHDSVAYKAAEMFVRMLGTVSGNLALIQLPFGGIYFAGGVARAFAPHFERLGFLSAFRDKGRFAGFMQKFSVHVIEDDFAALTGCANYLDAS
ncbi:MAG: glucokinase, partial [Pseudomonadota bacterium]